MIAPKILLVLAPFVVVGACGCGSDNGASTRPKVVHATGRVLFNGRPLADAHVTFTNVESSRSAYARTDADGKFTLTTFEPNDGAVPGKQQISVSKVQSLKQSDPAVDRTTVTNAVPPSERRWLIPRHYGNTATSGLTADITPDGPNETVLDLRGSADK